MFFNAIIQYKDDNIKEKFRSKVNPRTHDNKYIYGYGGVRV